MGGPLADEEAVAPILIGEVGVVLDTDMGDAGIVGARYWGGPWTGVVVPVVVVVIGEPTEGASLDSDC